MRIAKGVQVLRSLLPALDCWEHPVDGFRRFGRIAGRAFRCRAVSGRAQQSAVLLSAASNKASSASPGSAGRANAVAASRGERASVDARSSLAQQGLPAIERLKDYSATLVSRERIRSRLGNYEYMFIKIPPRR